jgi:hypothetical protein
LLGLAPPVVDTGEVDVLPDLRRDVANYVIRQGVSFGPQGLDGTGQVNGVPQDDGADHKVETGSTESLALEGAVADFAALVEEDCPGQLVAGLALVQPGPAAVAQLWAGILLGHEQGPLDPTYCQSASKRDPLLECAPAGGQNQAGVLTICRAC